MHQMANCRLMWLVVFICFQSVFSVFCLAQNAITMDATLEQNKVALNDFVEVKFTIRNAQPENFVAPPFNDFKIAGGPNQVTEMNVVNGAVSRLIS